MRIGGTVVVDLRLLHSDYDNSFERGRDIERALWHSLANLPDGADVILTVYDRELALGDYFVTVKDSMARAGSITVQCDDPETITKWCALLRRVLLGEEAAA